MEGDLELQLQIYKACAASHLFVSLLFVDPLSYNNFTAGLHSSPITLSGMRSLEYVPESKVLHTRKVPYKFQSLQRCNMDKQGCRQWELTRLLCQMPVNVS